MTPSHDPIAGTRCQHRSAWLNDQQVNKVGLLHGHVQTFTLPLVHAGKQLPSRHSSALGVHVRHRELQSCKTPCTSNGSLS